MFVMAYFFEYFPPATREALHLAISEDGFRWTPLRDNQPILWPSAEAQRIRDPHISRDQAGTFHLFFSSGAQPTVIGHATSRDGLQWSEQELLPVMANVPGTRNCWAPECFYDPEGDLYRILWSSTVNTDESIDWSTPYLMGIAEHRIWQTTTRDFRSYTPAELFFDPGFSVIDATLAQHAGQYLLAFKDERGPNDFANVTKAIHVRVSSRATGPWDEVSTVITPPLTEGPTLFHTAGRWIMLYEHHHAMKYAALASDDGRIWVDITAQVRFPPSPRHASVMEVDEAAAKLLRLAC